MITEDVWPRKNKHLFPLLEIFLKLGKEKWPISACIFFILSSWKHLSPEYSEMHLREALHCLLQSQALAIGKAYNLGCGCSLPVWVTTSSLQNSVTLCLCLFVCFMFAHSLPVATLQRPTLDLRGCQPKYLFWYDELTEEKCMIQNTLQTGGERLIWACTKLSLQKWFEWFRADYSLFIV